MPTYIRDTASLRDSFNRGLITQDEYEGLLELLSKYGPFIFEGNPSYNIDLIPSRFIKEGNLSWIQINMEGLRNG